MSEERLLAGVRAAMRRIGANSRTALSEQDNGTDEDRVYHEGAHCGFATALQILRDCTGVEEGEKNDGK